MSKTDNAAQVTSPVDGRLEITPQARQLLRRIRHLCQIGARPYCFAGQGYFAKKLGLSKERIKVYIRELKDNGLLTVERQGNRNAHYYPTEATNQATGQTTHQTTIQATGQAGFLQGDLKEESSSNKEPEGPAAVAGKAKIEEASSALRSIGFNDHQAGTWAIKDPELAVTVGQYVAFLCERKTVTNPPGLGASFLNRPMDSGFTRDEAGYWYPPPDYWALSAKDIDQKIREAVARRRKEREQFEQAQKDEMERQRRELNAK